jgi:sarcosine oxidase
VSATADVLVVGLGAMGASAVFALARRGQRVIAIDPFEPGHDRGSSHGESRVIRLSYHEHPSYVPLVRRAYEGWRELESLSGQELLTVTGILELGRPGSAVVAGTLEASRLHGIAHEHLTGREIRERFPQFQVPDDWSGVFQADGGFLRPERAIREYVSLARQAGAEIRMGVRATSISPEPRWVRVETDAGPLLAEKVVIAAGGWVGGLVPWLADRLTLTRQVLCWVANDDAAFRLGGFPVFIMDLLDDTIYGFPDFAGTGVKIASHSSSGTLEHPEARRQDGSSEEVAPLLATARRYFPGLAGDVVATRTCFYTRTADADFIIDRHPDDARIVIASPCSGHGFKFASAIGPVLADLATLGSTPHDISRFAIGRFELDDSRHPRTMIRGSTPQSAVLASPWTAGSKSGGDGFVR